MKSLVAFLSLLLFLCCGTGLAKVDINGFLGMEWGSSLSELQQRKKLVLTKENDGSGGALYALQNESMRFGKGTLTGIHCSFVQEQLQGVILLFAGNRNYLSVKQEATRRYGKPFQVDQKGGEMFTWPGDRTSIVLSYTKNAESGFLFLKPKKTALKPAKTRDIAPASSPTREAAAPPQQTPEDTLALLDQASQPQRITVQPAPSGTDYTIKQGTDTFPAPTQDTAATIEVISPEVQGLIDRDQALTRLCWDTVGPVADQACEEMKENVQRLQSMGWCMQPGEAKDGLQVVWFRCTGGQAVPTVPSASPLPPGQENPAPAMPAPNPRSSICSLVVEFFVLTADMRIKGVTPLAAEEVLLQRQAGRMKQLELEHIRETVELVYFDQQYNALPFQELTRKVEEQCLSGQGPYIQPLPQQ